MSVMVTHASRQHIPPALPPNTILPTLSTPPFHPIPMPTIRPTDFHSFVHIVSPLPFLSPWTFNDTTNVNHWLTVQILSLGLYSFLFYIFILSLSFIFLLSRLWMKFMLYPPPKFDTNMLYQDVDLVSTWIRYSTSWGFALLRRAANCS